MKVSSRIDYHLRELETARNIDSPLCAMPTFTETDMAILDMGCGIGQTFAASNFKGERLLVGLDPDFDCLLYGKSQFGFINFVKGAGESLPFRNDSFDMVISRVALPYTNIPSALREIERVLHARGKVWLLLHPFSMALEDLKKAVLRFSIRKIILQLYVIANGIVFHIFGKVFPFPMLNRYDSFQSISGMRKAMEKAGFENIVVNIIIKKEKHFLVTAQKI